MITLALSTIHCTYILSFALRNMKNFHKRSYNPLNNKGSKLPNEMRTHFLGSVKKKKNMLIDFSGFIACFSLSADPCPRRGQCCLRESHPSCFSETAGSWRQKLTTKMSVSL